VFGSYWNNPAATAEVLPDDGWFETGSLARWLPDGNLEIVGRTDDQVKIRGFRIEPAEVEAELLSHDGVTHAAVVTRESRLGELYLVAYVAGAGIAAQSAKDARAREMRAWLAQRLPRHMVPDKLVVLDALPLNENGKVARNALPTPAEPQSLRAAAPLTPQEQVLCGLFSAALGRPVGVEDDFFDLGGHSLMVIQLISRIRAELGIEIPPRQFFRTPTVAGLVEVMTIGPSSVPAEAVDLQADVVLPPDVAARSDQNVNQRTIAAPSAVLLTGATGFLGSFLLHELLVRTDAQIHCLVRAASTAQATDRLRSALTRFGLWDSTVSDRVIAIPGNLEQPLLGWDMGFFRNLAEQVDFIIHNGARVNHLDPYERLRAANVHGTREILRFAATGRLKPVHYVSTLGTTYAPGDSPAVITEEHEISAGQVARNGYIASKWVAEQLIRLAAERGIPAAVYRPSRVVGHSVTGACGTDDALWHFVHAMVTTGASPRLGGESTSPVLDLVPVDYVASAITHIALDPDSCGRTYHLNHATPMRFDLLPQMLRELGFAMEPISLSEWRKRLSETIERAAAGGDNSLSAVGLLSDSLPVRSAASIRYDQQHTRLALADSDIDCPPLDRQLIRTCIGYLTGVRFLPAPAAAD
ncbi:thioester reductase domain-containing protein, partial [Streptomyces sp. GbtcB6]|uniref:thioester reductase domain-containing protein n=1 Tax=Streptomyces sp. GbtcB6 TaxID=2824751 RepID=UPI001C30AD01